MAAPARLPSRSARASAPSSTVAPRPTLMKYADRFMRANWAAPSIERVSAVSGAAITTTSDRASRSISPARGSHSSGRLPSGSPVPAGQ